MLVQKTNRDILFSATEDVLDIDGTNARVAVAVSSRVVNIAPPTGIGVHFHNSAHATLLV
jgi:hypothetical protein